MLNLSFKPGLGPFPGLGPLEHCSGLVHCLSLRFCELVVCSLVHEPPDVVRDCRFSCSLALVTVPACTRPHAGPMLVGVAAIVHIA